MNVKKKQPTTTINGHDVEIVESYKYLGTIIDDKLDFDKNTDLPMRKSQQHLFCLKKLAKIRVDRSLMAKFYESFIESILTFSFICWYTTLGLWFDCYLS